MTQSQLMTLEAESVEEGVQVLDSKIFAPQTETLSAPSHAPTESACDEVVMIKGRISVGF